MGCCKSNSRSCLNIVGVITTIESLLGLSWNLLVILMINKPQLFFNYPILSRITVDFSTVEDKSIVYRIITSATMLNTIWCMSSIFLLIGNKLKSVCLISQWIITMTLVLIGNISSAIYLSYKTWIDVKRSRYTLSEIFNDVFLLDNVTHTILAIMFSQGIILILLNIAFISIACSRCVKIHNRRNQKLAIIPCSTIDSYLDDTQRTLTTPSSPETNCGSYTGISEKDTKL